MRRRFLIGLSVAAALAAAALPITRWLLWRWESNPVLRGRLLAADQGCFACHDPYAGLEIPNPGSRWGNVPRFEAGNAMMYATTCAEIEEFIRFGAPRSWLDDPDVSARLESQRLRMPAFEAVLSDDEVADLTAFACATEGVERPGAGPGRDLAKQHGCFACHGVDGSGGEANPGSLGGFIPGFVGGNFSDLVADEDEFREWVLEGTSSRLAENPLVRYFWNRQRLSMPAYRGTLDEGEVRQLWDWVQAVREDAQRAE